MGLLAVGIPLIIHLINLRRPRKIQFSTLSFFKELQKSTIRRIRIKRFLLLGLRMAAVLCLAIALAQPFLPPSVTGSSGGEQPKTIILLIDNSPSMERIDSNGPFLDQARQVAQEIIAGARDRDRFLVVSTNGPVNLSVPTGKIRAGELVEEIDITKTGNYLDASVNQAVEELSRSATRQGIIYLITDGQASQIEPLKDQSLDPGANEAPVPFQLVTVGSSGQQNIAVSDLRLRSQMLNRENPVQLQVEVKNFGEATAANQFVSMQVDDQMLGQYEIDLDPGETQNLEFELIPGRTGDIGGKIVIEGDEVTYDNEHYFVVSIPSSRSVLRITDSDTRSADFQSYLKQALEAATLTKTQISFEEVQLANLNQLGWAEFDALILDGISEVPEYLFGDLQRYVQNGKGILFLPSEQGSVNNYNRFLEQFKAGRITGIRGEYGSFKPIARLGALREGHPVLDEIFDKPGDEAINVDLPELFFYYLLQPGENTTSFTILASDTGDELLVEHKFGNGTLVISTLGADPGWSNFPVNPLFAPLFYRTALYISSSEQGGLNRFVLGRPFERDVRLEARNLELQLNGVKYKPETQVLPDGSRLHYEAREWSPGIVDITGEREKIQFAANLDIMESDFGTLQEKDLENLDQKALTVNSIIDAGSLSGRQLREELNAAGFGKEIWQWFVWLAVILLLAETLVSRLFRAESTT